MTTRLANAGATERERAQDILGLDPSISAVEAAITSILAARQRNATNTVLWSRCPL